MTADITSERLAEIEARATRLLETDRDDDYRRMIQALGAAESRKDWHAVERAYAALRDRRGNPDVPDLIAALRSRDAEIAALRERAEAAEARVERLLETQRKLFDATATPPTEAEIVERDRLYGEVADALARDRWSEVHGGPLPADALAAMARDALPAARIAVDHLWPMIMKEPPDA